MDAIEASFESCALEFVFLGDNVNFSEEGAHGVYVFSLPSECSYVHHVIHNFCKSHTSVRIIGECEVLEACACDEIVCKEDIEHDAFAVVDEVSCFYFLCIVNICDICSTLAPEALEGWPRKLDDGFDIVVLAACEGQHYYQCYCDRGRFFYLPI